MAKRFLVWVLGTFFLCIFGLSWLPAAYIPWIIGGLSVLAVLALVIKTPFRVTLVACLCSAALAALLFASVNGMYQKVEERLVGQRIEIEGKIVDVSSNSAKTLTCYKIKVDRIGEESVPFYMYFCINLYTEDGEHLPGATLRGEVEFFDEPIQFGFGREDRVLVAAYHGGENLSFEADEGYNLYSILYGFRNSIGGNFSSASGETEGLLKAVCLGDKEEVDADLYISLKRCGLSHVMAVSGLHLSYTVLLFGYLLISLKINYRIRHLIGIFIGVIFTVAVGAPLSCVRACIMLIIFSLGMAMDWFSDSLTSLSLAAFIVALLNPFAVRDVGFLLSLSATFGIVILSAPVENFLFPKKAGKNHRVIRIYRKFTGIFSASIAASLTTLPIIVFYFKTFSLIGPLANAFLVLIFELFFLLGLLMIMLGWIPLVGTILGWICDGVYFIIEKVAYFFGKIPFASVSSVDYCGIVLLTVFLMLLGIGIYAFVRKKQRIMMPIFAVFLCFITIFTLLYQWAKPEEQIKIAFIDVGQGDCTVISKGDRAIIIDYGGTSKKRYNLIDYLQDEGIHTVELLALTHLHNDHTNGIHTLLKNTYVEEIIYPNVEYESESLRQQLIMRGNVIEDNETIEVLDGLRVDIYAEGVLKEAGKDQNENCICYKISYGSFSLLITGDLDGGSEMNLLDNPISCTILKVGHHGSNDSSFYPFLKKSNPEIAIVSVGDNAYGLPSEDVYNRIESLCHQMYSTMEEGTIIFETDGYVLERIVS